MFFCESDPFCRSVLARHWPGVPIYDDVRTLEPAALPTVDVLVGGFPCQDVSAAGRRAGIANNTRSGLWYEYNRLIQAMRPQYAVVEIVKGLLSKGMDVVLSDLSVSGYDAEWASIPAAAVGAPHLRERIFIVAYPDGRGVDGACRVFAALERVLGDGDQPGRVSDWLGVRIDRASRQAIRQAYGGCVLRGVDDGSSPRLDQYPGVVRSLSPEERKAWMPRLKALGNGVSPYQSYAVARCILRAEGLI
jgi:DNA (cytosine-5)-methyltransferase 1